VRHLGGCVAAACSGGSRGGHVDQLELVLQADQEGLKTVLIEVLELSDDWFATGR